MRILSFFACRHALSAADIRKGAKRYTCSLIAVKKRLSLACIITSTPGTLWVDFNEANGNLTIHVLDLVDRAGWVRTIKGRYERLLLEIFA